MNFSTSRQAERPLRRQHSASKYIRPANQMSTHAAVFENFNEEPEEESIYLTICDIPPPVTPRHIITENDV